MIRKLFNQACLILAILASAACTPEVESGRAPTSLPFCPVDVRAQFEMGVQGKGKCRPRQFEGSLVPWRIR